MFLYVYILEHVRAGSDKPLREIISTCHTRVRKAPKNFFLASWKEYDFGMPSAPFTLVMIWCHGRKLLPHRPFCEARHFFISSQGQSRHQLTFRDSRTAGVMGALAVIRLGIWIIRKLGFYTLGGGKEREIERESAKERTENGRQKTGFALFHHSRLQVQSR